MELLILASLILLNGAFAMSEVALLTARKPRLATLARGGDALAAAAVKLAGEPTRFLSTVQIGITSIALLTGIFGEAVFAVPLAGWLQSLGLEEKASGALATGIVVISVTYISIVIGELVPKRLGQHKAEGIARLAAWPSADRRSRLVFVTHDLDPSVIRRLLAAFLGTPMIDTPDKVALTENPLSLGR